MSIWHDLKSNAIIGHKMNKEKKTKNKTNIKKKNFANSTCINIYQTIWFLGKNQAKYLKSITQKIKFPLKNN